MNLNLITRSSVSNHDKEGGTLELLTRYLLALTVFFGTNVAMAGADTTFNDIVKLITDWTEGSLGDMFALGTLAVGLAIAIVKQSLMPVVVAVAIAIAANWGPGILTTNISATGIL